MTAHEPLPVFLHISKCAGHTVRSLLHGNYAGRPSIDNIIRGALSVNGQAKVPASGDEDVALLVAEIRARQDDLAFVATTLSYGVHHFLDRPVSYFTLLRDPVERCVSYWYFAHRVRATHPAWSLFEAHGFDLERILASVDGIHLCNQQTRAVSGTCRIDVGPEELQLAKERIENDFAFVGTVERFEDSVRELAEIFGWRHLFSPALHVGDKSDAGLLPPRAREIFTRANLVDLELYRWFVEEYLPRRGGREKAERHTDQAFATAGNGTTGF